MAQANQTSGSGQAALNNRITVVGGGLAGLMATIKIAEAGYNVDLFSVVPVKRSHSVCAQGGINGAVNTKGEGDSPQIHFEDTVYGGDFLANQPLVKDMCYAAPGIIYLLDRMGVTFNRTPEGLLDFRRFGGTKHHRTAFAGATTGQQLLYALDEQVRRFEAEGRVTKYETWEFLKAIIDEENVCRGIVATHIYTGDVQSFPASAVIMATGGPGMIFGRSTNSVINTGGAAAALYLQGVKYANGEFIQVHPTAIPGEDKLRLMSESARGEGGRVWVPKDGKPWYFLEEWYPAYGNLVPRDIASRAIHKVVYELKLGLHGKPEVYLDVSHIPVQKLNAKLGGILEIYEKFVGDDPRKVPMRVFPAVHYSMGGLWIDFNHMTNVKGLFAAGECEYQYHGANRLGANSLVAAIYGGMVAGPNAVKYAKGLLRGVDKVPSTVFSKSAEEEKARIDGIRRMDGTENAFKLADEMGDTMTEYCTIVRTNSGLQKCHNKLVELQERWQRIGVADKGTWANQTVQFTRQFQGMLHLARVITQGAEARNESRGAHYKPEFPERDDAKFLKTTIAVFDSTQGKSGGPKLSYDDVDISLVKPRPRKYDVETSKS